MNTFKKLLRASIGLAIALSLLSCEQSVVELSMSLAESDGEEVAILSELSYEVVNSSSSGGYVKQFPHRIQYGESNDIFIMRSDGLLVYDAETKHVEPISISDNFSYSDANLLQCTDDPDFQYFYAKDRLYGIQAHNYSLIQSGIRACVGLPYSSKLTLLLADALTLQVFDGGLRRKAEYTLPRAATRAFYFDETERIVYIKLNSNHIYSCLADGSQDSLLFTIGGSISSFRALYPIDDAGKFITASRIDGEDQIVLIDAVSGNHQILGKVFYPSVPNLNWMPLQISLSRDRKKLLHYDSAAIHILDLVLMQTSDIVLDNVSDIKSAGLNADGSTFSVIANSEIVNKDYPGSRYIVYQDNKPQSLRLDRRVSRKLPL
jgi:hypothetical protein